MNILSRYRVAVRKSAGDRTDHRFGILLAAVCTVAVAVAVAVTAMPAAASSPAASLNVSLSTVTQAVKSVTISPSSVNYANCVYGSSSGGNLGFPNGACQGSLAGTIQGVQVANGNTPATILVNGADMVPSDNGTHWTLCSNAPGSLSCGSGSGIPGNDQYFETVATAPGYNTGSQKAQGINFQPLTNQGSCDTTFGSGSCSVAIAGQGSLEYLSMTGPNTSSDPSTAWTTAVTWTAS